MDTSPLSSAAPRTTPGKPYALVVLLQLHWFIRLRWVFVAATLVILGTERFLLPSSERPVELWFVVLGVGVVNVIWAGVSHLLRPQLEHAEGDEAAVIRSGQLFTGGQIALDLFFLTWILSLTGGVENPMSVFYLFHIAISGLLLRTWQAAIQSCWAALLYSLMCLGQQQGWLAHHAFLATLGPSGIYLVPEYVTVVVLIHAAAIFGTLYFTDRIGKVLDRREARLIQANAALRTSQRAIQDLQHRRSRFMQTAAHQLKSPLAMVQTLANLIRDDVVTESDQIKATCEKIVRRAKEGVDQVSELLALARVQEADPQRHRDALCDVGEVVRELCQKHSPIAREKGLRYICDIGPGADMRAHVDRVDLADCVGNLIENAIKYTQEGSVWVSVLNGRHVPDRRMLPEPPPEMANRRQSNDYIYVTVADTGIGIEETALRPTSADSEQSSLFDAFRRGNTALAANIPGTGLGLSIVREVVEQAGGFVHVRSRPGQGSRFTVTFPAEGGAPGTPIPDTRSSEIVIDRTPGGEHEDPATENATSTLTERQPG